MSLYNHPPHRYITILQVLISPSSRSIIPQSSKPLHHHSPSLSSTPLYHDLSSHYITILHSIILSLLTSLYHHPPSHYITILNITISPFSKSVYNLPPFRYIAILHTAITLTIYGHFSCCYITILYVIISPPSSMKLFVHPPPHYLTILQAIISRYITRLSHQTLRQLSCR